MPDRNLGRWRYYEECEDLLAERRYAPYGQSEPPRFWTAGVHPTDPPVLRSLHDPTSSPRAAVAVGPALQTQSEYPFPTGNHGSRQTPQHTLSVGNAGPPPPFNYGPSPTSYHPRPFHHHPLPFHHHPLPVNSHALRPSSAPQPVHHSGPTHSAHSTPDASCSGPLAGTLPQGFALFPQRQGSPQPRPLYPERNRPDNVRLYILCVEEAVERRSRAIAVARWSEREDGGGRGG
ncbi:hypothetical protein BJ546DRAFT_1056953 [Cryomyces antarcticus]